MLTLLVYEVLGRIVSDFAAARRVTPRRKDLCCTMPDSPVLAVGRIRGALHRDPTVRKDGVRSLETGLLAKKEVLRMAVYVLVGGGWLGAGAGSP